VPRHFAAKRMTKQWTSMSGNTTLFTSDSTAIQGSVAFVEAQTILRMLGEYVIGPDATAAPTAGDRVSINVGIAVVSSDAAVVTAVPEPGGEARYPWLYWANHPIIFEGNSVVPDDPRATRIVKFDIRSQRKVKPSESLVLITEYEDGNGAPSVLVTVGRTRVLVAIH